MQPPEVPADVRQRDGIPFPLGQVERLAEVGRLRVEVEFVRGDRGEAMQRGGLAGRVAPLAGRGEHPRVDRARPRVLVGQLAGPPELRGEVVAIGGRGFGARGARDQARS